MPLQQAIQSAMQARDVTTGDLLARMPQRDRSTVYRLLNGDTRDSRVSTLLAICEAVGVTPNDLLDLAGLWSNGGRSADPLDVRLRRSFDAVQSLAPAYKLMAVTQVERLVDTWREAADGLLAAEAGASGDPMAP